MIKTLDKKARLELLKASPLVVQEMYGSEENGQIISKTAKMLGINDELAYDTFALTVGDVILGSHTKESLGQMLKDRMELTDDQVKIATETLSDFLNKVPQQTVSASPTVINLPREDILKQDISTTGKIALDEPVQSHEVKSLRTFAEDVEFSRIHGYGTFKSGEPDEDTDNTPVHRSNQDDIMGRS